MAWTEYESGVAVAAGNNDLLVTVKDANLTIQDDSDTTKQAKFQCSGITTATTRTYTLPDADATLVGAATTQTLTNKTIVAANNTITIASSNLSDASNIPLINASTNAFTGGMKIGNGATIAKHLSATKTWDPGSMADKANEATTVTVTGAAVGDPAIASLTTLPNDNVFITAHVAAADTVRVNILNYTGGVLDIASGTLRVSVWQY